MLQILLDSAILIMLMQSMSDGETGWGIAILISIVSAVALAVLTGGLALAIGFFLGLLLAGVIVAGILGVVVSALSGTGMQRSMMIAGIFVAAHIVIALGFHAMMAG
jgi:hypothetical protein